MNFHKSTESDTHNLPACGVLVAGRRKRPDFANTLHRHNHPSLLLVVSGHGRIEYQDRGYDLPANSAIVLPAHRLHRITDRPRQNTTMFSVYFDEGVSSSEPAILQQLVSFVQPIYLPPYQAEQVRNNLRQMLFEQTSRPSGYRHALQHLLLLVILQLYRVRVESPDVEPPQSKTSLQRTSETLDYIASNSHLQFTLAEAAQMSQLSQRRFSTLCRRLTSKNYIRFVNDHRCEKAATLLSQTDMPIAAIAFEVGFEDLSTFYRAFKKCYGKSPRNFQN